jgi:hypothetical protein
MNKRSFIRSCFNQAMTSRECEIECRDYGFNASVPEIQRFYRSFEVEALPTAALDNWENMHYAT